MVAMRFEDRIKAEAMRIGFDAVGITGAGAICAAEAQRLREWVAAGRNGGMGYMERNIEKRVNPGLLLEGGRSVVVVGVNYKAEGVKEGAKAGWGRVSEYAWRGDYHEFIKERLRRLVEFMEGEESGGRYKICVDSVPLVERATAARAGVGFIGRNHMLINREAGPAMFLGEVITTVELAEDLAVDGWCSGCDRCIRACPTGALSVEGEFDARKCISYLTIEHKGEIDARLGRKIGDRIFGCDECLRACPYYERASAGGNAEFAELAGLRRLSLGECLVMEEEEFREKFVGTVIERLGVERLRRNAAVCLSNERGV